MSHNVTDSLRTAGRPNEHTAVAGIVSLDRDPPAFFGDDLHVSLEGYEPDFVFGPCRWGILQGPSLPEKGNDVLVVFDSAGRPTVVWYDSASAPTIISIPTISGSTVSGSTLTATPGLWNNQTASTRYAWQWFRGANNAIFMIAGANSPTYTTSAADIGDLISVQVIASNGKLDSIASYSLQTSAITAPLPTKPVLVTQPVVTGSTVQGSTLTATTGTWTNSPTSYAYQWRSSGTDIPGATSSTYATQLSDVGNTINVTVTATNLSGPSLQGSSIAVGPITGNSAPVFTVLPKITGPLTQGSVLTASTGTVTASPPVTGYTYQWYRIVAGAPVSVVQVPRGAGNGNGTMTFAFLANVTAGNSLILYTTCKSGSGGMSVATVTDTRGNTWSAPLTSGTGFGGTLYGEIRWVPITTSGACTVTVTYNGTLQAAAQALSCMEVSGLSAFDSAGTPQAGNGATVTTVCPVPSTSNEFTLAVAFLSNAPTGSPGSPFTDGGGPQTFSTALNPNAFAQLSGTNQSTATWTQSSGYYLALQALFKTASGGQTLIGGATNPTYTLQAGDVGDAMICNVTATNLVGSTTVSTPSTAIVTAPTITPISQLVDLFAGTGLDASWTLIQGVATVANNKLTETDGATPTIVASVGTYTLASSRGFVQTVAPVSSGVYTAFALSQNQSTNATNAVEIHTIGTTIYATIIQGGVSVDFGSTTYNATTMAYWSLRESGGTIFAEYSPDGAAWTSLGSTAYTMGITALYAQLVGGTNSTAGQSSVFSQFNQVTSAPPPPPGGGTFTPAGPYTTNVFFDDFTGTALDSNSWHATDTPSGDPNGGQTAFGVSSQPASNVKVGSVTLGGTAYSVVTLTASSSSAGANIATFSTGYWEPGGVPLKSWDHGTFVANVWLPPGTGMWPAFWLLNTNDLVLSGVGCEIDAMEVIMGANSGNPTGGFIDFNNENIWQTVHLPGTLNGASQSYVAPYNLSTGWTTVGCSFAAPSTGTGTITFYVNNVQTHQLSGFTWPPSGNRQWFLLLTLAMYNNPVNTYPQHYYVDWVGVWQ